ncbi:MAG: hypothetical protein QM773_18315 [Hyphomonadaceae bacterium]
MRNLIQIVSLFFILIGIVVLVAAIPPLIDTMNSFVTLYQALSAAVASLTPGGAIIIFGSVSYMLCSIDMRLEEMLDRPQPKPVQMVATQPQQPASQPARGSIEQDLF